MSSLPLFPAPSAAVAGDEAVVNRLDEILVAMQMPCAEDAMRVHVCVYACVYKYIHTYIHTCVCVCVCVCVRLCMFVYVVCVCVPVCVYTHIQCLQWR